jgi:hypothetical protein
VERAATTREKCSGPQPDLHHVHQRLRALARLRHAVAVHGALEGEEVVRDHRHKVVRLAAEARALRPQVALVIEHVPFTEQLQQPQLDSDGKGGR